MHYASGQGMYEAANLRPQTTGLPFTAFISQRGKGHGDDLRDATTSRATIRPESHAAVELWVARQTLLHAWHADEDDAHAGAVEDVADELEHRRRQPLGLVDDYHLNQVVPVPVPDLHALAAEL